MIGKLSGKVDYRGKDYVLIDVNGVGYAVYCSDRTLALLPVTGEPVSLYTDLLVKEDILQLFGFTTLIEKEWHRLLMTVQGVGAKASMTILGTIGPEGVTRAISISDWNAIKAAKGIGPKTAQRVVIELKDKVPAVMSLGEFEVLDLNESSVRDGSSTINQRNELSSSGIQAEALSALINLGYSHGDAAQAVAKAVEKSELLETPAVIKLALKLLAVAN